MSELIYLYIPIVILFFFMISLSVVVFSNKQIIQELENDFDKNDTQIKNIIDAVNYNDKKLFENQKYIYNVYEENNNFVEPNTNDNIQSSEDTENTHYIDMMKNYDALIHLTK